MSTQAGLCRGIFEKPVATTFPGHLSGENCRLKVCSGRRHGAPVRVSEPKAPPQVPSMCAKSAFSPEFSRAYVSEVIDIKPVLIMRKPLWRCSAQCQLRPNVEAGQASAIIIAA